MSHGGLLIAARLSKNQISICIGSDKSGNGGNAFCQPRNFARSGTLMHQTFTSGFGNQRLGRAQGGNRIVFATTGNGFFNPTDRRTHLAPLMAAACRAGSNFANHFFGRTCICHVSQTLFRKITALMRRLRRSYRAAADLGQPRISRLFWA